MWVKSEKDFEIPKNIDRYLAAISKIYSKEGKIQLQELIVNSQIRIHEEWGHDQWDGIGHAVYLIVPEVIYLNFIDQIDEIGHKLREDINKIHNIHGEYVGAIFLEMEIPDDHDWRNESGMLLNKEHVVSHIDESRLWDENKYRIFLSHKSEAKRQTAELKKKMEVFGVSCFVAHEDIHPTRIWQNEIENALFSMDAFVALMTEDFHDSLWTDQELGVAFGRSVPIISVKLGQDPYGFIGKFQALSCSWNSAAKEIVKLLIRNEKMVNVYIEAVKNCFCFDDGNSLAEILPSIDKLSEEQENNLISAFNENVQVHGSYGFLGKKPSLNGRGLAYHLTRITGKKYVVTPSYTIEIEQ